MKRSLLFSLIVLIATAISSAQVFITELTDPDNSSTAGRYVELYNAGDAPVDLGAGWKIQRYTNNGTTPQTAVALTGVIPPGGFFIICNSASMFFTTYGLDADMDIGTGGAADGNGDDQVQLLNPSDEVVDIFGVPGEDGSETAHDYEDGRAERVDTVTVGKAVWAAGEWNIWNDGWTGQVDSTRFAPEDFDPKLWIGDELNAEPDNLTGFAAEVLDFETVKLSWTDPAIGSIPFGYLIKASTVSYADIADPVDGTPEANDVLVKNAGLGGEFVFTGLTHSTTYYFRIYPLTNYGSNVDFLTGGIMEAEATTPVSGDILIDEDFETAIGWTAVSDTGDQVWTHITNDGADGSAASVQMNGYAGGNQYNVDWLISSPLNLDAYTDEMISFYSKWQYGEDTDANYLKFMYSTDYSGNGDPHSATWTEIPFAMGASAIWTASGDIDISGITDGPTTHFAFKYKSTNNARRWNVDEIFSMGQHAGDASAPLFNTGYPKAGDIKEKQFDIVFNINEACEVYYLVKNQGDAAPSISEIMNADTMTVLMGNASYSLTVDTAGSESSYDVYCIARDTSGNRQTGYSTFTITTLAPRQLELTAPLGGEMFYVNDTMEITWTSVNIDSLDIFVLDVNRGEFFSVTESGKVAAGPGIYYLHIPPDAGMDSTLFKITDANDTSFYSMGDYVYITDTIMPVVEEMAPANLAMNVSQRLKLVLGFNEQVFPGSGNITIKMADGTTVETIDVLSKQVSFDPYAVVIMPSKFLQVSQEYYVLADAGTFVDFQDNAWKGINSADVWSFSTIGADLFFSEYIEGSSNNKALEIYNIIGSDVDLSQYQVWRTNNGNTWEGKSTYPLSGTLKNDSVFTFCNSAANAAIKARSHVIGGALDQATYFNGNDAMGLAKFIDGEWILIDEIGIAGDSVLVGWDVAGTPEATKDHTLLRKLVVTHGEVDFATTAGSDPFTSDWLVMPVNYSDNLGLITPPASSAKEIETYVLEEQTGTANIDSDGATVSIEIIRGTALNSMTPEITVSAGAKIELALDKGTLAYYPLNGNANDESGSHNHGTVNGASLTPDRFGNEDQAYLLDGIDDNIDFGNILDDLFAGPDNQFSVSFWIYPTTTQVSKVLMAKSADSNCGVNERQFAIRINNDGTLGIVYNHCLSCNNSYRGIKSTSLVNEVAKWTHIALSYNGSTDLNNGLDRVKMYINGVEDVTSIVAEAGELGDMETGPAHLAMGNTVSSQGENCGSLNFTGKVDDIRVHSIVLSSAEVSELYNEIDTPGETVDFSKRIINYIVTAEDLSVKEWTATITVARSSEADILTFVLAEQTGDAIIDPEAGTVTIQVAYGTALTALKPTITVSGAATVSPASGAAADFSTGPVDYTVTADDMTKKVYKVIVTVAPSNEAEILTFALAEQESAATINSGEATVAITVKPGTSLAALSPVITLSDGASVVPASGVATDFSGGAVKYTVTAADMTTKDWMVTVTKSTTSVHDLEAEGKFRLYPNPSSGVINFEWSGDKLEDLTIEILSVTGKLVYKNQFQNAGRITEQIDLSNVSDGVYFMRLNTSDQLYVKKLIIE